MKIAQARKLLTEDIRQMTLEQLQRHRVKLIDAWRESRAEYGMGQAVMDGFYRQTGEDVTEYTPTDLWLTQNLSHRLDETIGRELELLSDHTARRNTSQNRRTRPRTCSTAEGIHFHHHTETCRTEPLRGFYGHRFPDG